MTFRYGSSFPVAPPETGLVNDNQAPDGSPVLSVAETDACLARGLRTLATKRELAESDMMTLRMLALSAAYRLEKLSGGGQ